MRHFSFPITFPKRRPRRAGLFRGTAHDAPASADELALFASTSRRAIQKGDRILNAVSASLRAGERCELERAFEELPFLFDIVKTAEAASRHAVVPVPTASQEEAAAVPSYLVSSFFLVKCHNFLMGQPQGYERLHLVTGVKVHGGTRTLDHLVRVALSKESEVGAVAEPLSLRRALLDMDEYGHSLHGLFHRHPGTGRSATRPSPIDLQTHERYERRYPVVGAILVKDGWVRFFGHRPFTISLYGKGVIKHEEHLFQIQNVRPVQDEAASGGDGSARAGVEVSPAGA
jgi:hypothetical protein